MKSIRHTTQRAVLLGAFICFAATPALAQTVGEILDKGGQKLDAAGARAALATGPTFSGRNAAGFLGTTVYKADGTLTSSGTRERDNFSNSGKGAWTVDDAGKVCAKTDWEKGQGSSSVCYFWFKMGDDYFTAPTDAKEQAAVRRLLGK
ncbi:MAG: DUF995 domain-containing protein [Betaproteobacteria bacterium]